MAGLLAYFGFSLKSHLAAHGARPDLDFVIGRLTPSELKAQRSAWKAVRLDYERLGASQRTNLVTRALGGIGAATTLTGGFALLDPAVAFVGGPATVIGVVIVFASGGWNALNLRRRREIAFMIAECERMADLIEAALDAQLPQ